MKQLIRDHIREKIKNIPSEKKQEYSFRIYQEIIKKFWHLQTRHIYIAMPDEIETKDLIAHLKQAGKKILHPAKEPKYEGEIDVIIIPWRAFTKDNKRLWRGKWWRYDRFLAHYPNSKKIWICFPEQIVDDIPQESHDIVMNEVLF